MKRTIVIGDVHGCIDELEDLLKLVSWKQNDRVVLVGDLVDRGPDSAGVVKAMRVLWNVECVLGNHDEWYVRCFKHELANLFLAKNRNPLRENEKKFALYKTFSTDDLSWLSKLPHYIQLDDKTVVVHGGLRPGVPLEQQEPNEMLRLRHVDPSTGKMASYEPEGSVHWTQLWNGPYDVIYGHHPSKGDAVVTTRHNDINGAVTTYGIDTGCCFGNKLTAWVHDDSGIQLVSVPARRAYAPWHDGTDETK